jgi:intracellular sulfur oxidation DsrE/DsrF family protein
MEKNILNQPTHRRGFMSILAKSAAFMSISSFGTSLLLNAEPMDENTIGLPGNPDAWFDKIKGKHRIVFDVTHPKDILPFAWPRVFLITNEKSGTPAKDCGVVVILRHDAIPYAFEDALWAKYNFGEMFQANDPETKKPAIRNPFWKPKMGAYKVPGFGVVSIGINELQESGVMFCVCDAAMTVYSAVVAEKMGMNAADVKKEWLAGLLPGIEPVPSGVWAVGRAQEHNCAYCAVA